MATQEKHYNLVKNSFILIEDYKQGSKAIEIHHYNKRIFISTVNDKIVLYTDNLNVFTRTTTTLIHKLATIQSLQPIYNALLHLYNTHTAYFDAEGDMYEEYTQILTKYQSYGTTQIGKV